MAKNAKTKIIIDTDVGIDDVEVLAYLLGRTDIEILGVTLVAGNAQMDIITDNLLKILTFLDVENMPVYRAGSYNLSGNLIETDGYFGKNALAGLEFPPATVTYNTDMTAPQALIHFAREYPKQIKFIFIGPLTNLALSFLMDNEFPSLVGSIHIMGSDVSATSKLNVTEFSEFNTHCDPIAYQVLAKCFSSVRVPIQMANLTETQTNLLPFSMLDKINEFVENNPKASKIARLFKIITDKTNEYILKNYWEGGFFCPDMHIALVALNPELVITKKTAKLAKIHLEGKFRGHTDYEDDENGFIELITKIDQDKAAEIILKALFKTE